MDAIFLYFIVYYPRRRLQPRPFSALGSVLHVGFDWKWTGWRGRQSGRTAFQFAQSCELPGNHWHISGHCRDWFKTKL